jgi:regulator of protease activity HflC (stomatin/prohibitin superfamily)
MIAYPWSRAEQLPPQRRGWRSYVYRNLSALAVTVMVVLLIGFVLYPYMVITVPSGHVGVLWKRFTGPGIHCWCILPSGTVLNPTEIRNEGLTIIWPWDKLFIYDLRLQIAKEKYNAISKDGVSVTAEVTVQYQLNQKSAAVLHEFMGPQYLNTVLSPEVGTQTRLVISNYIAEDVYSSEREKIQNEIAKRTKDALSKHLDDVFQVSASEQENPGQFRNLTQQSIKVINVLVLGIELPSQIVAAINNKAEQFYRIQEYKYRAQREAEESERKQIEANGIAAFQKTVSQGISDSYLRWRGIEATLALAQSQNTKIIIVGGGKDGLPIILGNVDAVPPANPVRKPGDDGAPSEKPQETTPGQKSDTKPNPGPPKASPAAESKPSSPLDLSDLKDLLSRLTGTTGSPDADKPAHSGAGAK